MGMTESYYYQDVQVDYAQVDSKRTMRPSSLVDALQSLAVKHSDAIGYDLDYFEREHMGWMLTNWHIRVSRWPGEGEPLRISTWCDQHGRVRADRDFRVVDKEGGTVCYASSIWVNIDTERRRPNRPSADFLDPYKFPKPLPLAKEDYAMPALPAREPDAVMETMVTRRDTDTNGHTNNAVYIDWATDTLSDAFYDGHTLSDMVVAYKKECRRGDRVRIASWREGTTILSQFTASDDPACVFGIMSMTWK